MEKSSKRFVIGLAVAGLGIAVTTQTMAAGPKVSGLIQADYASFKAGKTPDGFVDSSTIRRADIGLNGKVNNWWNYELQYRFSNQTVRNAWIGYRGFKPLNIQFGQYSTIYTGLENSSGPAAQTFITPASVTQVWGSNYLNPVLGLRGMGSIGMFTYQVGLWTPSTHATTSFSSSATTSPNFNNSLSGRDPLGFSARVTVTPFKTATQVLHFGVSYYSQNLGNNRTTVQVVPVQVRSTPALIQDTDNFKRYNVWGLEVAGTWGPFHAAAEYQRARYKAMNTYALDTTLNKYNNFTDRTHDGGYIEASYMITGESRMYNRKMGTFGNVKPRSQYGAWEVGLRVDTMNLRQRAGVGFSGGNTFSSTVFGNLTGGTLVNGVNYVAAPGLLRDWTLGVTYYATSNLKFLLNYTDASAKLPAPLVNKRLRFVAFRGQVQF